MFNKFLDVSLPPSNDGSVLLQSFLTLAYVGITFTALDFYISI